MAKHASLSEGVWMMKHPKQGLAAFWGKQIGRGNWFWGERSFYVCFQFRLHLFLVTLGPWGAFPPWGP